jgi:hypothetical protein
MPLKVTRFSFRDSSLKPNHGPSSALNILQIIPQTVFVRNTSIQHKFCHPRDILVTESETQDHGNCHGMGNGTIEVSVTLTSQREKT